MHTYIQGVIFSCSVHMYVFCVGEHGAKKS